MPRYCFVCPDCGEKTEVVRPMVESDNPLQCRICKQEMRRDYQTESVFDSGKDYSHPIHSDALAIMPSQVEEHKRLHPDVPLDNECRPTFTNYNQHQKYLDACGFKKARQRIRKKGKRIR